MGMGMAMAMAAGLAKAMVMAMAAALGLVLAFPLGMVLVTVLAMAMALGSDMAMAMAMAMALAPGPVMAMAMVMGKAILIGILMNLVGCASFFPSAKIIEEKIPVSIQNPKIQLPNEPYYPALGVRNSDGADKKIKALVASLAECINYNKQLVAILNGYS